MVVSGDQSGMLEYWSGPSHDYKFPKCVDFEYKTDTDLYELAKVSGEVKGQDVALCHRTNWCQQSDYYMLGYAC